MANSRTRFIDVAATIKSAFLKKWLILDVQEESKKISAKSCCSQTKLSAIMLKILLASGKSYVGYPSHLHFCVVGKLTLQQIIDR